MLSLEARAKRDELFKVGDMVTIRTVEDMIKEFGTENNHLELPDVLYHFVDSMFCYCGHSYKITDKIIDNDKRGYKYWLDTTDTDLEEVGFGRGYMFSSDMFELPEGKEVGND